MTRINSPHERASNIDLIFVSLPAIKLVTYKQLEDPWDSDHYPLLIEYKRGVECYRKRSNRLSTRGTDWDEYSKLVNSLHLETKNRCENEGRDITYANHVEIMYKAVNVATGRKEKQSLEKDNKNNNKVYKNNPVKWWDADCNKVIMERKQKLKTYLSDGSVSSFIEYKKSCAIVRRTVKTKKRECFKEFCNSINRWTGLSYVWKTVRILKNSFSRVTWNVWQTSDREKVVLQEVDKIAHPSVTPHNDHFVPYTYDTDEDTMNAEFSMAELNRAIGCVKRLSAPGRDGIDYEMIRRLPMDFRITLLKTLNNIWITADIPNEWRMYQVHFIDKIVRTQQDVNYGVL
ncbi:unnamed protein product [Lasius platythorax]|uniref:Endonuclease/exonuclease/phosphatase domain-containing protein n=1 Tax=Lasius platythorax TaxID=488582 RepID=A0AAV2P6M7_9HYME